jgi:hypothetical protein
MHSHVDLILESRWKRLRKRWKAPEYDKESFVKRLYDSSVTERGISFFNPWLPIFDEGCFWLKIERDLFDEWSTDVAPSPLTGVSFLVHKALTEALSFRLLIVAGYEDSAGIVLRAMMETLDLALLLFTDKALAEHYWADFEVDEPSTFWTDHLSKGRMAKRLETIVGQVSIKREHLKAIAAHRSDVFTKLSERVHSSLTASLRSYAHPSLEQPGLYSTSPFGRLSAHAPSLMTVAYDYIGTHGDILIASVLQEITPFVVDTDKRREGFVGLVARWNLLQEISDLFKRDRKRLERALKLT